MPHRGLSAGGSFGLVGENILGNKLPSMDAMASQKIGMH
jgi:hypothetical protein